MRTKLRLLLFVVLLLAWGGMAQAQEGKPGGNEAWRASLDAFAQEVMAISEKAEFIDPAVGITRIRNHVVFTNNKGEKIYAVFQDGFDKEFHGELTRRFTGQVSWRGVVESVETNAEKKVHTVMIVFPPPKKQPTRFSFNERIALSIPFSKLDAGKAPAKGSEFAFRGQLKKEEDDKIFGPIYVLYGLGPNTGKAIVGVSLRDVEPLGKNK